MPDDRPRHVAEGRTCRAPNWLRYAYFARAAAALAASAANSSRPNAVPESPQPPSAASVRITQVRLACVGSPETLVTISVISLTGRKLFAPLASPMPSPARRSQSEEKPEIRPRSELNSGCAELALNLEGSGPAGI